MQSERPLHRDTTGPADPRFGPGSWKRILHALGLGLFQPAVPISIWACLAWLLFDASGKLRPPGLVALTATFLVPLVPNTLLVGLGLVGLGRISLRDLGWTRPENPLREIALGLVGLAAFLAAMALVVATTGRHPQAVLTTALSYPISSRVLFLIAGAHIAFFEETVFRGYLQPALIARLGRWGGPIATAVVFAAWHPPFFTLAGFLVRLGLGLATGALRGTDRSLMAPFIAHACLWPFVGLA